MGITMNERSSMNRKTSGLFRLMAVLLVLIMSSMTVAEAAECASDPQSAELLLVSDTGNSDEVPSQNDANDHGVCPHGHCHSAHQSVFPNSDGGVEVTSSSLIFQPGDDSIAPSRGPFGLIRPPRA